MADQIVIDRDIVNIIIAGGTIIGVLIGALATVYTKMIIGHIHSVVDRLSEIKEYTHETRALVNNSHDRITNHIISHHTRKDP